MKKLLSFFVLFALFSFPEAEATFVSSIHPIVPFEDRNVLSFSNNEYAYMNGSGENITGQSILVDGMYAEWLPLNFSTNYSFNDMRLLTQSGQEFDGWRMASSSDIVTMIDIFMGGPIDFDIQFSDPNDTFQIPEWEGAIDAMVPFFRDTFTLFSMQLQPDLYARNGWVEGRASILGQFNDDDNITGFSDPESAPIFIVSQVSTARGNGAIDRTGMGDFINVATLGGREQLSPTFGTFLVKDITNVNAPSMSLLFIVIAGLLTYRIRYIK
jgi:hypothetical protein